MADFGDILSSNIRAERSRHRTMTQNQLEELLGMTRGRISDIETGRVKVLAEELPGLCRALDVPLDRLFFGADRADLDAMGF